MQEIRKSLSERFNEFEPEVSEAIWENLELRLEQEETKNLKNIRIVTLKWFSIAASIAVIVLFGWWLQKPNFGVKNHQNHFSANPTQTASDSDLTQRESTHKPIPGSSISESNNSHYPVLISTNKKSISSGIENNAISNNHSSEISEDSILPQENTSNLVSLILADNPTENGLLAEPETIRMPEVAIQSYLQAKYELNERKQKQQANVRTKSDSNFEKSQEENNLQHGKFWKTANLLIQHVSNDEKAGYQVYQTKNQTIRTVQLGKIR
ncbi:MAG: hypothetical protein NZ108_07445, partial [Bacteroidia bacterium]|nr:hypothetical protein [Bacteroidia bacterium]